MYVKVKGERDEELGREKQIKKELSKGALKGLGELFK